MADNKSNVGDTTGGVVAGHGTAKTLTSKISSEGKWTNGLKDLVLECPLEAAWDLFSDWGNWQRWYSAPDVLEHREGEHRKPGCARSLQYPDMSVYERLVEIDNEKNFLLYSIEDNNFLGGMKGFVSCAEFRDAGEGKTIISYWNYEVEPVEHQTAETFHTIWENVVKLVSKELERGAQRLAAGLDPLPVKQTLNTEDSTTISH